MKNKSSIAIGKVASALLNNMAACGFTPSLTYRTRAHKLNNEKIREAVGLMKATLALAGTGPDAVEVSDLRLRAYAVGPARSKDAMNWQVDDLLNFLQSWVDAGRLTQERGEEVSQEAITKREPFTPPKAEELVYFREDGSCVTRRFSRAWPPASYCELSAGNGWHPSSFTVGEAIEMVSLPQFFECDENGEPLAKPVPKVMHYQQHPEGYIYRITEGKCYVDILLDNGGWREVITTAEQAMAHIALGEYVRCDEEGSPVHHDALKVVRPEPRPVSALTMFNGPAKPTPKPYTEATDPETGHTYRVDSGGNILVRQAGSESFYAGNCNVYVVKAVIRLGLISDGRES